MPLYALIAHDRPGLEHRKQHRSAHLEHMAKLDAAGRIRYGGPLMNDQQDMVAVITINRPDAMNAFTTELSLALQLALEKAAIDESVRCQIAQGASGPEIRSHALSNGMVPMRRAAMTLAEQGVTTLGEVFKGLFFPN